MLLNQFLPTLPWPLIDVMMNITAALGGVLLTYAIFLESEKRQDLVFMVGSLCLLFYALWIGNKLFSLAMAGVFLSSSIELLEIMLGLHKKVKPNK